MPHIQGLIHGTAAMVTVVVGSLLTEALRESLGMFLKISDTIAHLLIDVVGIPIAHDTAISVLPIGILMGIWMFAYELQRTTS